MNWYHYLAISLAIIGALIFTAAICRGAKEGDKQIQHDEHEDGLTL